MVRPSNQFNSVLILLEKNNIIVSSPWGSSNLGWGAKGPPIEPELILGDLGDATLDAIEVKRNISAICVRIFEDF